MAYGTFRSVQANKISIGERELFEIILDWRGRDDISSNQIQLNIATALANIYPKIFKAEKLEGFLWAVETVPGTSGDIATNLATLCSITLTDSYGYDVMDGNLANRSSSAAEKMYADPAILLNSEIVLNIASTKAYRSEGRIIMIVER